jgi:hypothetical protein
LSDKDFKVKNKLQVKGITSAGPVVSDASGNLDSTSYVATQYGGTGTSTSPNSGQILYSSSGTNYAPTDLSSLDVKGAAYQTSAPSNPVTGQLWVDSDETGDSLDPYIIRRKTITATAGQTVFTTDVVFTDGYEQVYYNGVLLVRTTDYTTSGGTNTVTLLQGASAGDTVEIISSTPINLVNTITSSGGTITAPSSSTTPLKIVGASSQSADLFEILNSSNAELFAIRSNGRTKVNNLSTEADTQTLGIHANANNASSGTSVILWGKDMNDWGGDVHYLADSRGVSGAHRFWNWDGTNFLQRVTIDKNGNFGIGAAPSSRLDVYNSSAADSVVVQRVISEAPVSYGMTSINLLKGAGSGGFGGSVSGYLRQNVGSGLVLSAINGGTVNHRAEFSNSGDTNLGFMRMFNVGQPASMIVSGGTNCIRLIVNRNGNYYRGFMFDVFGNGGYDWPGNGITTYFGRFMVTFLGTDTSRVNLVQEYGRSYLNNSGTEVTYNTFSQTVDSNYLYLTINFKGVNSTQGYRPYFFVTTYDPGNGGSIELSASNNQVYDVVAI